ncbi:chaperone protein DnaJ-like isoform X1 [Neltuma alba]|uniref:chaperone protein DnaJ-like isoform X1 n=1 Tax=Neltuma alba TaxID=207710 RepID=UPI0010A4DAAE|nr:chaperone protein DnaJ-like isoform X1 [Prosopis alba]
MANGEEKGNDFYAVMGLDKECTESELRNAYKKLAMKWHPDRCSASGNSKFVEEAKKKFQAIQQAYSVLSDANKRFLYDIGVYDSDDDDIGMGDFLNEMAAMMSQTKPNENGERALRSCNNCLKICFKVTLDVLEVTPTLLLLVLHHLRGSATRHKEGRGGGGVRGTGSSKRRHGRKQRLHLGMMFPPMTSPVFRHSHHLVGHMLLTNLGILERFTDILNLTLSKLNCD